MQIQYNLDEKIIKKNKLNNTKEPKIYFGKRDLEYYKTRYELLKKLHEFYN